MNIVAQIADSSTWRHATDRFTHLVLDKSRHFILLI